MRHFIRHYSKQGLFIAFIILTISVASPVFACSMVASQQAVDAQYAKMKAQCSKTGGSWSQVGNSENAPLPFNPPAQQVATVEFDYNPNDTEPVRQQKFVQWKQKLAESRGAYQAKYQKYTEEYHKENLKRMLMVSRYDSCRTRSEKEESDHVTAACFTPSCDCGENMCFSLEDNACVQYEAWKKKSSGES